MDYLFPILFLVQHRKLLCSKSKGTCHNFTILQWMLQVPGNCCIFATKLSQKQANFPSILQETNVNRDRVRIQQKTIRLHIKVHTVASTLPQLGFAVMVANPMIYPGKTSNKFTEKKNNGNSSPRINPADRCWSDAAAQWKEHDANAGVVANVSIHNQGEVGTSLFIQGYKREIHGLAIHPKEI